jgi:IS5 family transposase
MDRCFCGFAAQEPTPERTAFVRFRRELVLRGLDRILFDEVTRQLKAQAVTVKTGTLVDATFISSASVRDEEAAWARHKRRKAIHGFKAHVAADSDTALVEDLVVTPGNAHDGRTGGEALPENPGDVYADSGYRGTTFASAVQAKGGRPHVVQTGVDWEGTSCGSCGPGTITSNMCAAGLRRFSVPGSATTACDAYAGWDWGKQPCRSD